MKLNKNLIEEGVKRAQLSTWGNKYNPVVPSIKKEGENIYLSTNDTTVILNSFDEITLTILVKFLFVPIWLVKQFYSSGSITFYNIDEKINSLVKVGLIWIEDSVTGRYLRPTYALFNLFGLNPYNYTNIPFNTLTHTISEEKAMFDIMSGLSPIIEKEQIKLPRVSELGFSPNKKGTNVIAEEDFRNPTLFTEQGINDLNKVENAINKGILNKQKITPELQDFKYFTIVKKVANTGRFKKDYSFHIPDLVIPIPRDNGKSKSIAVEVELTDKRVDYKESLLRYKDNNKFGVVYWLCNSSAIATSLKNAYKEIGGCGSCKVVLQEFVIPSPEF